MKKNRKKADTYRFNGYPHLQAGSIHSVQMADLESLIGTIDGEYARVEALLLEERTLLAAS